MSEAPNDRHLRGSAPAGLRKEELVTRGVAGTPTSPVAAGQRVRVDGGWIEGGTSPDGVVRRYLGVPYAAPPVGERRWREPAPVVSWNGVRPAVEFGPSAMQAPPRSYGGDHADAVTTDEDCLSLNVWTGAAAPGERRPVLLWVHGGGFIEGGSTKPEYDGEALARLGLIVVGCNYRLNVFGFLAHPGLSRESAHRVSGNYGLLDVLAALGWVRRNIAAFGGDPARITLAGESAGSIAASALTGAPRERMPIVGVIAQSLVYTGAPTLADLEVAGAQFADHAGFKSLDDMRRLSARELLDAYLRHGSDLPCRPVADNWLLRSDTLTAEARGWQLDVPVLTGCNADEASWMPDCTVGQLVEQGRRLYGDLADPFLALYSASDDREATTAQISAVQDRVVWQHLAWARAHATNGNPVYAYFFTHEPPLPRDRTYPRRMGAYHSAEIPYAMANLNKLPQHPYGPGDQELARLMSAYWSNFARTGNPNGPGLPDWSAFDPGDGAVMELGQRPGPRQPPLRPAAAEFWEAEQRHVPHHPGAQLNRFMRF